MQLTFKTLEQITQGLRSDDPGDKARRAEPRVGLRARLVIVPIDAASHPAAPVPVWVRDVSSTGLGLLSRTTLPQGTLFRVLFDKPTADDLRLYYRVAHTTALGCGAYAIGAVLQDVRCDTSEQRKAG